MLRRVVEGPIADHCGGVLEKQETEGGGGEREMQRGVGAARRAVAKAAATRLNTVGGAAVEGQQGVVPDVVADQVLANQWFRGFSALPWTSPVTLQTINPKVLPLSFLE